MNRSGSSTESDLLAAHGQFIVKQFSDTIQEFPPRMKPASFSIDQVLEKMEQCISSN